jgi:hypothetical protein
VDDTDSDHICTDDKHPSRTAAQLLALSPWSDDHAVIVESFRLRAVHSSPARHNVAVRHRSKQ